MTMTIQYVPNQYVAQIWPQVEEHIESAIEYGHGDYTLDQVRLLVSMGHWLLLIAVDEEKKICGAATVSFNNYPNDRIAFITYMGGKLITGDSAFEQMCAILKSNGATKIQGAVRPVAARLFKRYGFNERGTLVETKI